MLPIQTIVTDMDDTLLTEDLAIPLPTQAVLARCRQRGIRIILASGRAAASLRPFAALLDTGDPFICCNGAQALDGKTGEMLVDLQFTHELALECIRFLEARGMYAQFYQGEYFYFNREGAFARQYAAATRMTGRLAGRLDEALTGRTPKVLGIDTPERILSAYREAQAQFAGRAAVTMSKPYFLEMNPAQATKGAALARLSELMDLKRETTLAFGDSLNDLSMLRWARYGVAVANAREEVKAAVSLGCPANGAQGVARFICENVLGEEFEP